MEATNTAGQVIHFDARRVYMITGPLPTDNAGNVFYLHGVSAAPIPQLPGDPEAFIMTMPNGKNYVKLTFARTQAPFYVNSKKVVTLAPVPPTLQAQHPTANAVITVHGRHRFLIETVDVAKAAIDAAGGII